MSSQQLGMYYIYIHRRCKILTYCLIWLEKAQQEKRDLERELKLLEQAQDPKETSARIMQYVIDTKEPLIEDNPLRRDGGCCIIL